MHVLCLSVSLSACFPCRIIGNNLEGDASALHKIKKHKEEWNSWYKVGKLIPMMTFLHYNAPIEGKGEKRNKGGRVKERKEE